MNAAAPALRSEPSVTRPATARAASLEGVDADAFAKDLYALRAEVLASLGEEDLEHLKKVETWGRRAHWVGVMTAWAGPNPISVLGLAIAKGNRWLLMHHVGHRGYDRVPNVPKEKTGASFARNGRRFADFFDWIEPESWIYEHNVLHHAFTSEETDPDLIERNVEWVHRMPMAARYVTLGLLALTWRATYYAPATLKVLLERERKRPVGTVELYRSVIWQSWLPYAGWNFVGFPMLFSPLGPLAVMSAASNVFMADVLTNLHTFLIVGPNHAGDDLYRWEDRPASGADNLVRQVVSSVNYHTGGDLRDVAHMFLNYQIEHHLFPDIPMRQYQRIAPRVKAICEKHGVPYVQESVWKRFRKMADVFVGKTKMLRPKGSKTAG